MILGIDYGPKNIGLAISEGFIAEPYEVIHHPEALKDIITKLKINKIIVGVSEGQSRELAQDFGKNLQSVIGLPIEFVDETLTSFEAGDKNHAKAAAFILQRYLDNLSDYV